jgi:hypothetical protein
VVVSGEPNITPIFSRIWLMKITTVPDRAMAAVSFAQRLGHEPRLQPGKRVPHIAVELGSRDERGDGVDHDDVDGIGADERLGDLERLLARVGWEMSISSVFTPSFLA